MARPLRPDFLLVGAPKAGTTALHSALAQHPEVFMTQPKEPKFWLCDGAPPPHWRGPGDRHSQQEWIWRPREYAALFAPAEPSQVRGESTPFYLWSRGAHRRIGEALDAVRVIAVVRDPVDRAYSNWMHLWSDGLEPVGDFAQAMAREDERVDRGYAPFWRYAELGRYGEQLRHLRSYVDPERILVLRYRDVVDQPKETLRRACQFLGISPALLDSIPSDNARPFVEPGWRARVWGPVVRAGAEMGAYAPPHVWRRASVPLNSQLRGPRETTRRRLTPEQRERLIPRFAEDIALLSEITGEDYRDWLSAESRGSYRERVPAQGPSTGSGVPSTGSGSARGDQGASTGTGAGRGARVSGRR